MSITSKFRTLVATLRAPLVLARKADNFQSSIQNLTRIAGQVHLHQVRSALPPHHLSRHGYSVYSQNDEDGILAEIFRRIGATNRRFIEFGVGNGMQCNTTHLLMQGWSGGWMEIDPDALTSLRSTFRRELSEQRLRCLSEKVTVANIESLLVQLDCPATLDLLSIDIDGNDYWVWQAIRTIRPRVVVIEYNAAFGPDLDWAMAYDPDWKWDGTRKQGASLAALARLGREKGYHLIGCSMYGVNAFFVEASLAATAFPTTIETREHFAAPLYCASQYEWPQFRGHPPTPREILDRATGH